MWSEEHRGWWAPELCGYTWSLLTAGRYTEAEAKEIERKANQYLDGELHEVAMPDPLPRCLAEPAGARERRREA